MNEFAEKMRGAAMALLPPGAFLRRDRGGALYVTDAPRFGGQVDWSLAGFRHVEGDGVDHLAPAGRWIHKLEALYPEPPDPLCAEFRRFSGPPMLDALWLFARGMKALDGGTDDPGYARALRQLAAVCLRKHLPGGGLYACALVNHMIEKERGL